MISLQADVRIYVAFRFHVNFYHSYRGDTPDEHGFGKDIRIIRRIISDLDELNGRGIDVRGTWDFDNRFSLESIVPAYAPDLLDAWRRRITSGVDEVEVMSYNNGIVSAHTEDEFDIVMQRTMSNKEGSGLRDLFGSVAPVVRPQEMMFTPSHVRKYRQHGIEAISLYYSSIPFNTFSNFIPRLTIAERYNPVRLFGMSSSESLLLIPAYNHGDISDHISLASWLRGLQRRYRKERDRNIFLPRDLLVCIDLDADDDFWWGIDIPILKHLLATAKGFKAIVESIASLPFVRFTTPWTYASNHSPVAEFPIRQDTADGGFDGYSSWAEKSSNHHIWSGIEQSRKIEQHTRRLAVEAATDPAVGSLLDASVDSRICALSTTHFGLSMPVMNVRRLHRAGSIVAESVRLAAKARVRVLEHVQFGPCEGDVLSVDVFDDRISGSPVLKPSVPVRRVIRLGISDSVILDSPRVVTDGGAPITAEIVHGQDSRSARNHRDLIAVVTTQPGARTVLRIDDDHRRKPESGGESQIAGTSGMLSNDFIGLDFDMQGNPVGLRFNGTPVISRRFLRTAVRYGHRRYEISDWYKEAEHHAGSGVVKSVRYSGVVAIPDHPVPLMAVREYTVVSGLPYLFLDVSVRYPDQSAVARSIRESSRLGRNFDEEWREVMPCEIELPPSKRGEHYRVWKHNYQNEVTCYDLDYHTFSRNRNLDSSNNQITNSWLALSTGDSGMLIAQGIEHASSFAFCPLRTRLVRGAQSVFLNPFGTYDGKQLRYQTRATGMGKRIAMLLGEHLRSGAPSYAGYSERFSLLIAPYQGAEPSEQVRAEAQAFSSPPMIVSYSPGLVWPRSLSWESAPTNT